VCLVHSALVVPERNNIAIANQDHIEAFFKYPGWEQEDSEVDEISSYELLGKPNGIDDNVLGGNQEKRHIHSMLKLPEKYLAYQQRAARANAILAHRGRF